MSRIVQSPEIMADDATPVRAQPGVTAPVILVTVAAFVLLLTYELCKQYLFPTIDVWQSHFMTIMVGTIMVGLGSLLVLQRDRQLRQRLSAEIDASQRVQALLVQIQQSEVRMREVADSLTVRTAELEASLVKAKEADAIQKRLVAILEASPDFIGFANPNMEIQYINRAGRAMVGIGATEDIAGLTIPDVHPTWFLNQIQEQMRVGLPQDHWVIEGAFKDRAGAEIPVSMVLVAHRGEDGTVTFYSTISRDIRERKRGEEEQQKLVSLVENSDEFIGLAGLDERITFLNRAACRLVGLDPREMTSKALWDFVHTDAVVQARNVALPSFQSAGVWHGETLLRHQRTGVAIPVEMSAFIVPHPQTHQPLCLATVAHDISQRKQAEADILALNANLQRHAADLEVALAESEEFAYAAAHNLRSPLRGVDGFCQVVLEEESERLSPEGRQHLERVRRAAHTMGSLVDALLRLSRLSRMKMDPHATDMSALARSIAEDLRQRDPDRQVEFVIADGVVAECDGPLARVLLEELLKNAWKFTTARPQARIEFGTVKQHDQTSAFFVRDDGVGFDMAYADKLFVPFQHLHTPGEFEGTGIGLATVQRIVRRHGGRVWAEGAVGHGATFYFTL